MSELERKTHLSHLSKLPPIPDIGSDEKASSGESSSSGPKRGRRGQDYTPLPWSEFFDTQEKVELGPEEVFNVYRKGTQGLLLLLLHGGGYTGLTWATFVEKVSAVIECQALAPDLRAHGLTQTKDEYAMSMENMTSDVVRILEKLYPEKQPPTIVIGHSMGGALAVQVANSGRITDLKGLGVIDVVEGSAMEALSGMKTFLRSRPTSFPSLENAIGWCLKSGTVHCGRSARVSFPSQVVAAEDGSFVWRTDLTKTEDYWPQWFQGLTRSYLSVPCPKLLILAGTDRLDKDMTVAQMQGKFQMLLVNKAGHAVQEDAGEKLSDAIATFAVRHRIATPKAAFRPSVPAC